MCSTGTRMKSDLILMLTHCRNCNTFLFYRSLCNIFEYANPVHGNKPCYSTKARLAEDYSRDWKVLELPENSDQEQTRQAYLKLVKRYHPDSGSNEASSSKFNEIDDSYRNLQKKFADERHNRHKIEGEYGLYYDQKKGQKKVDDECEQDITHTAPQHRQYLSYDGIGIGTPAQREKQYQVYRTAKVAENLLDHRINQLEQSGDIKDVAIRKNTKELKKIKTGIGIERLVEDLIQDSMARGDFDNLTGKGKPLRHDTSNNPYIDFTTHKMNQLLIDNGFTPEWILLGKEIRETTAILRERLLNRRHKYGQILSESEKADWTLFLRDFKVQCDSLNLQIHKYNLVVPILNKQVVCFELDKEAARAIANFSEDLRNLHQEKITKSVEFSKKSQNDVPSFIETLVSMFKIY